MAGERWGTTARRIVCALATEPDLLVANEPSSKLDTTTERQVLDLFADFDGGHAIVLAPHDGPTLAIAARVSTLRDDRV